MVENRRTQRSISDEMYSIYSFIKLICSQLYFMGQNDLKVFEKYLYKVEQCLIFFLLTNDFAVKCKYFRIFPCDRMSYPHYKTASLYATLSILLWFWSLEVSITNRDCTCCRKANLSLM